MKTFKIIGPGCNSCRSTAALIAEVAAARNIPIDLEEIHDPARFAEYGVTRTPAVWCDGKIIFTGGGAEWPEVESWLTQIADGKESS